MTTLYANGSRSFSLSSCATAFSDVAPAATDNISIQVTGNNTLDLLWTQDAAYTPAEYTVFKDGAKNGTTAQATYTDPVFILNAGSCYAVSYVDACGNQSAVSTTACPIILSAILQNDNTVALSWNAYNGWVNGVDHYTIEKYTSDGQLLQSLDVGTVVTFTDTQTDADNQVIAYRIVAHAVDGSVAESTSNSVIITKQPNIYHPNTFTPNSDGLNDTFQVMSQYTASVEFMVFNRWGEMLFYTTDLNVAWDGTYKGNAVPEGTYVFRCFLTDLSGLRYERSGNVVLLRKR
jgi:gliding motility-associated-like protein